MRIFLTQRRGFIIDGAYYDTQNKVSAAHLMKEESGQRGSNPQQPAWEADTLPLSYARAWEL
jgi:hypothetical protein